MKSAVPVVDIFSGPGGLAEGFARCLDGQNQTQFKIALSVEKERSAHETLLMRAFLRKFGQDFPPEYYEFLDRGATRLPNWKRKYPTKWSEAVNETLKLELGTPGARKHLIQRLRHIRDSHHLGAVLLGGPPCQSYSLVGRARNNRNASYNLFKDKRQSLYSEYAWVLGKLKPAVAVLENVQGILSAPLGDNLVIDELLQDLRNAAGPCSYHLYTMTRPKRGFSSEHIIPYDFLVRAEEHGIPQARHRVFVVCVHRKIAKVLRVADFLHMETSSRRVPVLDIIGSMPMLRSRISRGGDSPEKWRDIVLTACDRIEKLHIAGMAPDEKARFRRAIYSAKLAATGPPPPFKGERGGTEMDCRDDSLCSWIRDVQVLNLPNNEMRGHMRADLERYLFASAFAIAKKVSPKAADYPDILAPNHANWKTGKFADRFRVQLGDRPSTTVTSHISKDGHYFIHPDPTQCRSLTVREVARLQTFPDNYFFSGGRTQQYVQVGNAVPPFLALKIATRVAKIIAEYDRHNIHSVHSPEFNSMRQPDTTDSTAPNSVAT